MRICLLSNPVSIHTQRWSKFFISKGHEIHIIYYDYLFKPIRLPKIEGVYFHRIPFLTYEFKKLFYFFEIIQLLMILKKIKPDIIHAHYISHFYCWYVSLIDFHPYVVSVLGSDVLIHPNESPTIKNHIKTVLQTADIIHVHSDILLEAVLKLGAPQNKIKKILWGVDLEQFHPNRTKSKLRKQLNLTEKQIIISTRNFKPVYDIETLIKSIQLVIQEYKNVEFVIKGRGPLENKLKSLAKKLDIMDYVTFVGFGPYSEVPLYLNASDIYVSTSLSEGWSISLCEALASGLPVVVTELPANTEWIKDDVNGFIVPLKDYKLLAMRITELLKNRSKRKEFRNKNLEIAQKELDQNKMINQIEKIYITLIEKYNK